VILNRFTYYFKHVTSSVLNAGNAVLMSFRTSDIGANEKSIFNFNTDSSSAFVPQTSVGMTTYSKSFVPSNDCSAAEIVSRSEQISTKNPLLLIINLTFIILLGNSQAIGQAVSINPSGAKPDPSAMLDVISTDKGVLIPRMTETQRDAISSPSTSLMIYQTDGTQGYYYYTGSLWKTMNASKDTLYLSNSFPVGSILPWAGASGSVPTGFLLCDGTAVNRTTYADLYTAVGNAWGSGNNSTTFNLPDLRGRFLRGADLGTNRDNDAVSRTQSNAGGNTGNVQGSIQSDQSKHLDRFETINSAPSSIGVNNVPTDGTFSDWGTSGNGTGSNVEIRFALNTNETRPKNASVNFIICFDSEAGSTSLSSASVTLANLPASVVDSSRIKDSDNGTSVSVADESNIIFNTGGSESARIDATGKMGLGTTDPQNLGGHSDNLFGLSAASGSARLTLYEATDGNQLSIGAHNNGSGGEAFLFSSKNMVFGTDGSDRVRIDSTGTVSIGTPPASPYQKLSISSNQIGGIMKLNQESSTLASEVSFFVQDTFKYSFGATDNTHSLGEGFFIYNQDRTFMDFFIDGDNGYTGIGTTTPVSQLDVRAWDVNQPGIISAGNSDRSHFVQLFGGHNNDPNPYIQWKHGDPLSFATDSGGYYEFMRINNIGNVGIGTSSPETKFHIQGEDNSGASTSITMRSTATSRSAQFRFDKASDGETVIGSNHNLGVIAGRGYDGTDYQPGSQITFSADGAVGANDMPGRIEFATTPDGTDVPVERMRIDNAGNVGIGTDGPSQKLEVSGDIKASQFHGDVIRDSGSLQSLRLKANGSILSIADNNNSDGTSAFRWYINGEATLNQKMILTNAGNLGIGTGAPIAPLHVDGGTDASLTSGGFLMLGEESGNNIIIDDNEILSRFNGSSKSLWINQDGGDVFFGGNISVNNNNFVLVDSAGNDIEFSGSGNSSYDSFGAYVRATVNPPSGGSIFRVLSSGGAERLRVEHGGKTSVSDNFEVGGDATIEGELNGGNTGAFNMLPLAMVSASSAGTIYTSTGNVSVVNTGTGRYEITVSSHTASITANIVYGTVIGATSGQISISSSGGVYVLETTNGTGTNSDRAFSFMVYAP